MSNKGRGWIEGVYLLMHDRDIICLSSHYWKEAWFRKQQFMSRLAQSNRVLYVEPSFPLARPPQHEFAQNRMFSAALRPEAPNIWCLQPPRKLPKWSNPSMSKLNFTWFGLWISRAARTLGFRDPVLWSFVPEYGSAISAIPHRHMVFDLCDDYVAYSAGQPEIQAYKQRCLETYFRDADLVLATTSSLCEKYSGLRPDMKVISNGVDYPRFAKASACPVLPDDLAGMPRPIVGFIGVLFSFLDYERIRRTAENMPGVSFVFVGRHEYTSGVNRLSGLPNVHLLGPRPPAEIPSYVSAFDVCFSPFRVDEVSRHVSPLKVFEYLACGKPVVSARMEALAESLGPCADELIYWSDPAASDFSSAINTALSHNTADLERKRQSVAREFSWDELYSKMLGYLEVLA